MVKESQIKTLDIRCGAEEGKLYCAKFGPGGTSRCIEHPLVKDFLLNPIEFAALAGKSSAWKVAIKTEDGFQLQHYFDAGELKTCTRRCACPLCIAARDRPTNLEAVSDLVYGNKSPKKSAGKAKETENPQKTPTTEQPRSSSMDVEDELTDEFVNSPYPSKSVKTEKAENPDLSSATESPARKNSKEKKVSTPDVGKKQSDIRKFFSTPSGSELNKSGAGSVTNDEIRKKAPVKLRFEGGELARINSTEEVARKDQQQQHRVMVPASTSSANPPEMLKDELFDKTIEMNSSRSSGDITILEEHLNDDVTIIGERGGRRSKRSADLAEIKSAQTQKKVKTSPVTQSKPSGGKLLAAAAAKSMEAQKKEAGKDKPMVKSKPVAAAETGNKSSSIVKEEAKNNSSKVNNAKTEEDNKGKEAEAERERPPSRGVKRKLRSPTQQNPVEMKTRVVKVTSSGNVTKTVTAAPKTVNTATKTAATVAKTSNGSSVTSTSALIKDSEAPLTKLRSPIKQEPLLILGARSPTKSVIVHKAAVLAPAKFVPVNGFTGSSPGSSPARIPPGACSPASSTASGGRGGGPSTPSRKIKKEAFVLYPDYKIKAERREEEGEGRAGKLPPFMNMIRHALTDLNKTGEGCTKLEILLYILRKFKPKDDIAHVTNKLLYMLDTGIKKGQLLSSVSCTPRKRKEVPIAAAPSSPPKPSGKSPKPTSEKSAKTSPKSTKAAAAAAKSQSNKAKAAPSASSNAKTTTGNKQGPSVKKEPVAPKDKGKAGQVRKIGITPKRLKEPLATICKAKKMSRVDALQKVWTYIHKHRLLDPKDKTRIICDEKLRRMTKCKAITSKALLSFVVDFMEPL